MVLGDEAQGIALVKADDMIDFVQQALKWQIKRIRTKTQKSEENTAGGNGDFMRKHYLDNIRFLTIFLL